MLTSSKAMAAALDTATWYQELSAALAASSSGAPIDCLDTLEIVLSVSAPCVQMEPPPLRWPQVSEVVYGGKTP